MNEQAKQQIESAIENLDTSICKLMNNERPDVLHMECMRGCLPGILRELKEGCKNLENVNQ